MIRYRIGDVETAGFKGPDETGSGVVEVAWVELDEYCNPLAHFESRCNPGRPIEDGAFQAHGISNADVMFKPELETVFANHWGSDPVVFIAHNKQFDLKFLAHAIPILSGSLCTLALARQYITSSPNHKLQGLREHLGLEGGSAHSALGDCYTTLSLLKYVMALTERTLPELVKLDEKPKILTEMPFGTHKGKRFSDLPKSYLEWMLSVDMPADVMMSARQALTLKD